MSALIISLCVSVGQFQALEKRVKRSHEDGLTAITSAKNETIDNNFLKFNVNTRGWQMFDNWKINIPQLRTQGFGKIAYSVVIGKRERQRLLISGASDQFLHVISKRGVFANWLYAVDTNSWQTVDNGEFPPYASSPFMIKLCSKIIAFTFDQGPGRAWIFDTMSLNWQKTHVYGSLFFLFRPKVEVVAFAVVQSQTNCLCHQSAFVLLQTADFRRLMQSVRCVDREGTESYKLIRDIRNTLLSSVKSIIASSYSSTIVLYDPAKQTLWKFESETWTNVTAGPYFLRSFYDESLSQKFGCVVSTRNNNIILFNICNRKVLNFDLNRNTCILEDIAGNIPDKRYNVVSSIVEHENTIIVFTNDMYSEEIRVWKFMYELKVWTWEIFPRPDAVPSFGELSTYAFKSNYVTFARKFTGVHDQRSWNPYLWNLDLRSMQWWKKHIFNSIPDKICNGYKASSWIDICCFVAICNKENPNVIEVWIYNATDNKLRLLVLLSSINARYMTSFVSVNKTTAILFGGINPNRTANAVFGETWIMHFQPMFKCRQSFGDMVQPSARFSHATVMMQSKMYVFGGVNASGGCLNDLWVFDVNTERWSEVIANNGGPSFSYHASCEYSAASTPGLLLIVIYQGHTYNYGRHEIDTWMFIVHTETWHLIAPLEVYKKFDVPQRKISKSFMWKGFLVMFDIHLRHIKYLEVRCPAGFTTPNISDKPCEFCKKGFYRETIFSDPNCVPCPNGLTTISLGALTIKECSVCNVDRCLHGKCVPDFNEGSFRPACRCYDGFTGSTCQYPTYFLIGAGIILFVAVASAGATAYLLLLSRKRKSESALQNEVTVLTDVWQIDEDEVMPGELLGSGASGSVYKAFYRDLTVAVKKMVAVGFSKSIEDFETEIMFMRTVRHKNIVLFIGAGKSQPGDAPFLVMEYMERGSLRNVLYDLSIDIDYDRKLSFAMDSARGMHFLHTLEPPRIHRDLKSDNLLVSKDWIVKVADFGLGRTVNVNIKRNDKKHIRRQNCSNPQHISLLPKREGLSFAGVGTARWRAPELTLREPYDTAVDVYRCYS